MADFWSQFPTSGKGAPTYQPPTVGGPAEYGLMPDGSFKQHPAYDRSKGPFISDDQMKAILGPGSYQGFNDPKVPQFGSPGFDPQNPPPFYRPRVDPGGYVPTDSQRQAENDWMMKNLPQVNPGQAPTAGIYHGTIGNGGGTSTLGNFLMNPQAMQAIGGMARNIGGLFGSRPAQQQGGMMPMRGLFGSAMGGALGQPLAQKGAVNPWHQASQYAQSIGATAPMSPWAQAGQAAQVMMRAPDGTTQSVDPAHVDHYTGLGAQVINGSSYGGGGY